MKSLSAVVVALALSCSLAPAVRGQSQQPSPEKSRRVVHKVAPQYPELARKIHLGGTVRLVATVGADGSVKKVELVGGAPILVLAAQNAVSLWRYVPGEESRESVELTFAP